MAYRPVGLQYFVLWVAIAMIGQVYTYCKYKQLSGSLGQFRPTRIHGNSIVSLHHIYMGLVTAMFSFSGCILAVAIGNRKFEFCWLLVYL